MASRLPEKTFDRRVVLAVVVSLLIGAFFLWLAARELEWSPIVEWLGEADLTQIAWVSLVYLAMFTGVMVVRAWRWRYLLAHLGDYRIRDILAGSFVGFAAITVFPLRLGELVRPYAIARRTGCPMSSVLGAAVVERVVDGLSITAILFLTLASYSGEGSTESIQWVGLLAFLVFSGVLAVCLMAGWKRAWTLGILERWLPGWLATRVVTLLGAFLDGVAGLREGQNLLRFTGMTGAYWGLNAVTIAFFATYGFGLDLGPWEGLTVLAILVVGIMIPAGPAMAGNYELFALEALGLFCARSDVLVAGAACVAAMHVIQFLAQVGPGVFLAGGGLKGLFTLRRSAVLAADSEVVDTL